MGGDFAAGLDASIRQSGLPVRRVADLAGIPHQTLANRLKGMRPRWPPALIDDLRRLGLALEFDGWETEQLLRAAGGLSRRSMDSYAKEVRMGRTSGRSDQVVILSRRGSESCEPDATASAFCGGHALAGASGS